jgi:hypothetical protein
MPFIRIPTGGKAPGTFLYRSRKVTDLPHIKWRSHFRSVPALYRTIVLDASRVCLALSMASPASGGM